MKKEEFFDTLGDVEQKYINEAFFDDLDNSIGVAKPGKARFMPLKIAAPIAAGLAVIAGASVLVPKLKTAREWLSPAASAGITVNDISACKEMLLETQGIPENANRIWQTNLIDIDGDGNKELFVSSGDKDDFPGVYAFAKTENGIEIAGSFDTEENLCNAQSIMLYNKDGESFWYYNTSKTLTFNEGRAISGALSTFKVTANDGVISAERFLASDVDYDDDSNKFIHTYTINGTEVSDSEFYKEERKFNSQPDIESINNSDLTLSDFYAPLCVEELPEADRDDVYGNNALTLARATLCSQTFGEYEVSVVGQRLYSDRELENSVAVDSMIVVLSKNGVLLDSRQIATGSYKAYVKADNLDEVLDFGEFDGTFLISVKYYGVTGYEPVSFDIPQSEKYFISDDGLSMLY